MSVQRYCFFTLLLTCFYSWIYFSAWKNLEKGLDQELKIKQLSLLIKEKEFQYHQLQYQVFDLATQTDSSTEITDVSSVSGKKRIPASAKIDFESLSAVKFKRAYGYFKKAQFKKTLQELNGFSDEFPLSTYRSKAMVIQAQSYMELGDMGKAVSQLESLIELFPETEEAPLALEILSDVSQKFEKHDQALGYLEIIAHQFPKYSKEKMIKERISQLQQQKNENE